MSPKEELDILQMEWNLQLVLQLVLQVWGRTEQTGIQHFKEKEFPFRFFYINQTQLLRLITFIEVV